MSIEYRHTFSCPCVYKCTYSLLWCWIRPYSSRQQCSDEEILFILTH